MSVRSPIRLLLLVVLLGGLTACNKFAALIPLNNGNKKMAAKDYHGAIADFNEALRIDPGCSAAFLNRGIAKRFQGDYRGAIADYTECLKLTPKQSKAYLDRALARELTGEFAPALDDLNHAVTLDSENSHLWFDRGWLKEEMHDFQGAIDDYTQSLALDPRYAAALNNRGLCRKQLGDLDNAIKDYNAALAVNPKETQSLLNRGTARLGKGNLDGAIADYSALLAIEPKNVKGWNARCTAKRSKGDVDGALADSQHAIDLNPNFAGSYAQRGVIFYLQQKWSDAINNLRRSGELDGTPRADYSHLIQWIARTRSGDQKTADAELSEDLGQHWKTPPDDWPAKVARFLLGQISESELLAAISTDSKKQKGEQCEAKYYTGMKKLLAGNRDGAVDCFKQCLATGEKTFLEYELAAMELKWLEK